MRAVFEFTLPEERAAFDLTCSADDMHSALCAITKHVRQRIKYAEIGKEARAELELLRSVFDEERVYDLVDMP